ncbi:methyltransferase domain protein [Ceratobasidium sp. AG-Ba]|nr:methyltransferase domain protein [Ceratobasidium sp. AG-Ba]
MATFAKSTFNAASYASFRPTYPKSLYDFIYGYHAQSGRAGWDKVVDLGCGTGSGSVLRLMANAYRVLGQATVVVAERFRQAVGCDPSPGMVENARSAVERMDKNKPTFEVSPAEKLSFLKDESVDMAIAAQAAHWFDYKQLFPELARVLKPGGTVAIWNYNELRFKGKPSLDHLISKYSHGEDSLGPYWEQPGRSILEGYLRKVPVPTSPPWDAASIRRVYFVGTHEPALEGEKHPVILSKYLSWDAFQQYLRTWSSLHNYLASHPDDKDSQGKDIVDRFVNGVREKGEELGGELEEWRQGFTAEWPLALILLRKGT